MPPSPSPPRPCSFPSAMLGKKPIGTDNLASGLCILYYRSLRLLKLPPTLEKQDQLPTPLLVLSILSDFTKLACEMTKVQVC
jgi:hypothetical protein